MGWDGMVWDGMDYLLLDCVFVGVVRVRVCGLFCLSDF